MQMSALRDLFRAASGPLCDTDSDAGAIPPGVRDLLAERNGFYAFTSALHVRPHGDVPGDVLAWNRPDGWREAYGKLAYELFFFAEDAFGNQFACDGAGRVVGFNAETAGREPLAESVRDWVSVLMGDWRYLTGYPLAHDWQQANRPLAPGERLLPQIPFVVGGEFSVGNLAAVADAQAMTFRGDIARQIADLPDGAEIVLRTS